MGGDPHPRPGEGSRPNGAAKLLVDGRNALDPKTAAAAGLLYRGFSRAYEPREQLRISVDPNAVDRTLGWRPDTNLSAGLKQTLSVFDAL